MNRDLWWPRYEQPDDLAVIEATPLLDRGLPCSTYELVKRAAERWPAHTAITTLPSAAHWRDSVHLTYGQLLADVNRTANLLRSRGVHRGTAVAMIAPNCLEMIVAMLAAQVAGIATPINPTLPTDHVAELVTRCGADVVIAAGPQLDLQVFNVVRDVVASLGVDTVLFLRPSGEPRVEAPPTPTAGAVNFLSDHARHHDAAEFHGTPPAAPDLAAMFHTGGTTGLPKLAAHTNRNQVSNAWMVAASSQLEEGSAIFAGLPLFHVNALIVTVLAPLMRGQRVVWAGPLGYRDTQLFANFWRIVEHHRIAAMSAVPTVYATLARMPVDADISTMRTAIVGASPLPDAVRRDFETATAIPLLEGYGLTEATCASVRSLDGHARSGSVGQRLPYQHVKAVRVEDSGAWHDLPNGDVGTLAISGPTVFAGYVSASHDGGRVVSGQGKLVNGWLDTGDRGWVDDEGFVYLSGRVKDIIIRGGHNIDPAAIEAAMMNHPDVTGTSAVGQPDIHSGEVPVVYVTVLPDSAVTAEELIVWGRNEVGEPAARPKFVRLIDSLPVTAVGKPSKLPLRADATRIAVEEALAGVAGVEGITVSLENGEPIVGVQLAESVDPVIVSAVLDRFTFQWRTAPSRPPTDEGMATT